LAIAACHKASGAVGRGAAIVPKEDGLGELSIVFVRELGDIEASFLQHDRPHFAEGALYRSTRTRWLLLFKVNKQLTGIPRGAGVSVFGINGSSLRGGLAFSDVTHDGGQSPTKFSIRRFLAVAEICQHGPSAANGRRSYWLLLPPVLSRESDRVLALSVKAFRFFRVSFLTSNSPNHSAQPEKLKRDEIAAEYSHKWPEIDFLASSMYLLLHVL
jgi:hypothetical protein